MKNVYYYLLYYHNVIQNITKKNYKQTFYNYFEKKSL